MISLILPTLGNRIGELNRFLKSLENQNHDLFELIVISQQNHDVVRKLLSNIKFVYKHIQIDKLGLSQARNIGLQHASGDVFSFPDDDCWYPSHIFENILSDFYDDKHREVICYQIKDPIKKELYKFYPDTEKKRISVKEILQKSSIEIFVKKSVIEKTGAIFDDRFGLGALYPSGEENIFLIDLYKRGVGISYLPKVVVFHKKRDPSHFISVKSFIGKGPMFRRMFNLSTAIFMILVFYLKKRQKIERGRGLLLQSVYETCRFKK